MRVDRMKTKSPQGELTLMGRLINNSQCRLALWWRMQRQMEGRGRGRLVVGGAGGREER